MKKTSSISKTDSSGFTLIEVMVAMVIFAIGLLGLAGLQATALNSNHASYTRTQATLLAYDMADRIRANPSAKDQVTDYVLAANDAAIPDYAACVTDTSCDCVSNFCSATKIRTSDHSAWITTIGGILPSGTGSIGSTINADGSTQYTINVLWDEERNGDAGTLCTTAAGQLECVSVDVFL